MLSCFQSCIHMYIMYMYVRVYLATSFGRVALHAEHTLYMFIKLFYIIIIHCMSVPHHFHSVQDEHCICHPPPLTIPPSKPHHSPPVHSRQYHAIRCRRRPASGGRTGPITCTHREGERQAERDDPRLSPPCMNISTYTFNSLVFTKRAQGSINNNYCTRRRVCISQLHVHYLYKIWFLMQ